MSEYKEPTIADVEREAVMLRVSSGFKVTLMQARDRVAESLGWVNYDHMIRCKSMRHAA